jgi:cytochrome c553
MQLQALTRKAKDHCGGQSSKAAKALTDDDIKALVAYMGSMK